MVSCFKCVIPISKKHVKFTSDRVKASNINVKWFL